VVEPPSESKSASVQPVSVMSPTMKLDVASLLVKTRAISAVAVVAPLATVAEVMVMVGAPLS